MGWLIALLSILVISVILIIITLITLPQLGDERKNLIKMKAQSHAFAVTIFVLLIHLVSSLYSSFRGVPYNGISPWSFLLAISTVYLVTLLIYKKKYGD